MGLRRPDGNLVRTLLNMMVFAATAVVPVLALLALGACTVTGTPVPPPVRIEPEPNWKVVWPTSMELQGAADTAAAEGNDGVAQLLEFYADTEREYTDIASAAITADGAGLVVVRSHLEVDTPLEELVRRTVNDAAEQNVTLSLSPTTLVGQDAWRVEQPTSVPDLMHVEIWFDSRDERWSVDVLGASGEVDRLAGSVRVD